MFSLDKLTDSFAQIIGDELGLDTDKKQVIAYGAFALIHTLLSIALVVIFGIIFNVLIQSLVLTFTMYLLRKYSGGAHANSPINCAVIGTVVGVGLAILLSMAKYIDLKVLLPLELLTFILSFATILKLAPVDSLAKPIRTQEKRNRMKKGSIMVLCTYVALVIINLAIFLATEMQFFLLLTMSICAGIAWQTFTLTHSGHATMHRMDAFLSQINLLRRS